MIMSMSGGGHVLKLSMRYLILYVADFEKSLRFYRDVLGVPVRAEHGTYVAFDTGSTILAFNNRESAREVTGLAIPDGEVASQSFEMRFAVEDVPATIESLRRQGVTIVKEPVVKPWGQTVAYVADPDGHYLEICSSLD